MQQAPGIRIGVVIGFSFYGVLNQCISFASKGFMIDPKTNKKKNNGRMLYHLTCICIEQCCQDKGAKHLIY
jgi:hypothetical protein